MTLSLRRVHSRQRQPEAECGIRQGRGHLHRPLCPGLPG